MTELEHKRLIAKNTVALYVRMLVRLAVTLYTSRIVLDVLGVDDFALCGIVGGIVTLFSFLQTALSVATQRFMSVELGCGNLPRLKRVFDVSMTLYLIVAVIIVVIAETLGLWFLNTQLVIPPERLNAVNWVFQFAILSTCVDITKTPYNASIITYEKMSFYAWISIADVVLKLGVVFLLTVSPVDKLVSYAGLSLGVSLVIFFITRRYTLHKFTICRFRLTWDKPLFREMAAFSGWTLCDSGAQLAVTQGRVFLLNLFTPLVTNAAMSIATHVSTAVYNFVIYFQSSFNPQITKASAAGNQRYLQDLVNQTSKFSYYMIFAITLPILLNMEFILDIWLKEVPQYTVVFCSITLLYYLVESLSGPLWITTWAAGKIRRYQITVSLIRITTLPATWLLLKYGMEPWTVLLVWVLVNGFCYLYRLMYVNRHSGIPLGRYIREVFIPVFLISVLAVPLPLLTHYLLDGWTDLLVTTAAALLSTGILIWLIGLKPTEKKHIIEGIKNCLP